VKRAAFEIGFESFAKLEERIFCRKTIMITNAHMRPFFFSVKCHFSYPFPALSQEVGETCQDMARSAHSEENSS
jgi:hypothetical protein